MWDTHSPTAFISIHALREEGDAAYALRKISLSHFYPRPPRGGRPASSTTYTLSQLISIHALREEGDYAEVKEVDTHLISIHALREEGDQLVTTVGNADSVFLSTPSARRAT